MRLRTEWIAAAIAAAAAVSLTACLVFTPISVHGDPERPTFEPEGTTYCGLGTLRVSKVDFVDGSWVRRELWAIDHSGDPRRVPPVRYGEVPEGWKLAEWLPNNVARPLVLGAVYAVELQCGKYRGSGAFELGTYSGGLRLRNLDIAELTRRVEASRAGSSPAHR